MKNFVIRAQKSTDPATVKTKQTSGNLSNVHLRLAARLASLALGAACFLGIVNPAETSAAPATVSQLRYIQVLVQLVGDDGLFSANAKPGAYVQWAMSKGMEPAGGWKPGAKLSSDVLTQTLVQLYGLNPRRFGGDFYRILERDGIVIGRAKSITSEYLAALIDNPTFALKTHEVAGTPTSPHKPDDDDDHGGGGNNNGNNGNNPKPPPGKPPPHHGHPHRGGKPGPRK